MIIPGRRGLPIIPVVIGTLAAIAGVLMAVHYHRLGLTLSHYDARGHLVVARRIVDSITPGWQQIGAVWLPLPHLLNALPVQIDLMYRSGASAVAISIASFAIAAAAIAWIVIELTGSRAAGAVAAAVFGLNPNLLYLQSTPMTEPLLIALTTASVAMLVQWCGSADASTISERDLAATRSADLSAGALAEVEAFALQPSVDALAERRAKALAERPGKALAERSARLVGVTFALACLTRYEAWFVTVAALGAAVWTLWRRGSTLPAALRLVRSIAVYPVVAVLGFVVFSRVVIGSWFVASGFFVAENKALGLPVLAAAEIWWGTHMLSGSLVIAIAAVGALSLLIIGAFSRRRADAWIVLSLAATAALPWAAFVKGHPFRIRYMVPLLVIEAIGAGVAAGLTRRAHVVAALLLLAIAGYDLHPLDARAPMVVEAQWDRPNGPVRQHVTDCLVAGRDAEKIMASMGSLGHYMQETSHAGFALRDYLHEGNGDIWLAALDGPKPYAGWILIEEKANGGDMLAKRAREEPHFLDGYTRVCEGAGLALYRRNAKRPFRELTQRTQRTQR
ncbi:MAG TPA: hypothetical protein VG222_17070 [Vicinamibacterales bacterium]|nr:hypothetical protein [Vicinamibacterales bacterium]